MRGRVRPPREALADGAFISPIRLRPLAALIVASIASPGPGPPSAPEIRAPKSGDSITPSDYAPSAPARLPAWAPTRLGSSFSACAPPEILPGIPWPLRAFRKRLDKAAAILLTFPLLPFSFIPAHLARQVHRGERISLSEDEKRDTCCSRAVLAPPLFCTSLDACRKAFRAQETRFPGGLLRPHTFLPNVLRRVEPRLCK